MDQEITIQQMRDHEKIIKDYFARNKNNYFLMNYGQDLSGLLHSAWINWRINETENEYNNLKNLIRQSIEKFYKNPFKIFSIIKELKKEIQ